MQLRSVLRDDCLVPNCRLGSKDEVLRRVSEMAAACPALAGVTAEAVLAGLKGREELGSTGFGDGIAIPHCRLAHAREFVVGLLTIPEGVDFDAMDGAPVRVVVFIVAPDDASAEHVRLLSRVSQGLMAPGIFAGLISASNPATLRDTLLRGAEPAEDENDRSNEPAVMLHVMVRGEELFSDVLTVINGVEHARLTVLDCDGSEQYLRRLPLFSAFWAEASEEKDRMIVAVLHKRLMNETIRRLERQIGRLSQTEDVLVAVQDLLFCGGGLTA